RDWSSDVCSSDLLYFKLSVIRPFSQSNPLALMASSWSSWEMYAAILGPDSDSRSRYEMLNRIGVSPVLWKVATHSTVASVKPPPTVIALVAPTAIDVMPELTLKS